MKTVVRGRFAGMPREVAWEEGRLAGDEDVLAAMRRATGRQAGPPSFPTIENPNLTQHMDFVVTAFAHLEGAELIGDVPPRDPLPEGALP